jgi:HK97 family phage prohead protease
VKLVDSHNIHEGTKAIIGTVPQAKEDKHGLFFKAKLSGVQAAQDVRQKVKEGILDALSFGYDTVKSEPGEGDFKGARLLKELKLYEISVCAWGMNPVAAITGAKGVLSVSDLQLAPKDTAWDASAAKKRITDKIGGDPSNWSSEEWAEYAKAFLWRDSSMVNTLTSYHLQIADVISGTLSYVWNGVQGALAATRTAGDSYGDIPGIEADIKKLYSKFDVVFPEKDIVDPASKSAYEALKADMELLDASIRFNNLIRAMRG